MTGISIRQYVVSDLDGCRALWTELTQHHREIYSDETIGGEDHGKYFDAHLAKVGAENVFVAVDGTKIVGMAGLELVGDDWTLEPIIVSRERRGCGIGKALLADAVRVANARGIKRVRVGPVARNTKGISFFRNQGFDKLGEVYLYMELVENKNSFWKGSIRLGDEEFEY